MGGRGALGDDAARRCRVTEVAHPHATVFSDEHIVGLEVAMNDAGGMRGGEAMTGGDVGLDDLGDGSALLLPRAQALAAHHLHRDVGHAVRGADVVDGDHVGMVDLRHRARFAHESIGEGLVGTV